MNPTTIKALLNEADVMEERAVELRAVAAQLQKLFDKRKSAVQETNGILLSDMPMRRSKRKAAKARKKRKYTKRSKFWGKKKTTTE